MTALSQDQELFAQLKQRLMERFPGLQEEYDQEGRLLHLNLGHLGLVQLPPELLQFTSLQELGLSGNELSRLPPEVGQLISLRPSCSTGLLTCPTKLVEALR